jgi:hypothetical protein
MNMLDRSPHKEMYGSNRSNPFARFQDAIIIPAIAVLMFALGVIYGRSTVTENSPQITHHQQPSTSTYGRFGRM